jgi:hypothetical protein
MRTLWKCVLVLAFPAGLALADEPNEQTTPNGTTLELMLLRQKSVQEELKISPELAQKITGFTNKDSEEYQNVLKLGEAERRTKIEEMENDNKKFLKDNLSEEQQKRLHQIMLQVTGLMQLTKPEAVKLLNITDEQQEKFKEMQKEARQEFRQLMSDKNRESRNEKLAKLRAEIDKKIDAVLTDDQKAKVREIVGEPFKGELVIEDSE